YIFPPNTSPVMLALLFPNGMDSLDLHPYFMTLHSSDNLITRAAQVGNIPNYEALCLYSEQSIVKGLDSANLDVFQWIVERKFFQVLKNGNLSRRLGLSINKDDVEFQKLFTLSKYHALTDDLVQQCIASPIGHMALKDIITVPGISVKISRTQSHSPIHQVIPLDDRRILKEISQAVSVGNILASELLISNGADVNDVDVNDYPVILRAVASLHFPLAEKLMKAGARLKSLEEKEEEEKEEQVVDIDFLKSISRPIFQGMVFVISGTFRMEMSSLARLVIQYGAEVSKTPTGRVTHLLAGDRGMTEYGSITGPGSKKWKDTMALRPVVVREDWINRQIKKNKQDRIIYLGEGQEAVAHSALYKLLAQSHFHNNKHLFTVVRFLFDHDAPLEEDAFDYFVQHSDDGETLRMILDYDREKNGSKNKTRSAQVAMDFTKDLNDHQDPIPHEESLSILHLMVQSNNLTLLTTAIKMGADPNIKTLQKKTPLIVHCVRQQRSECYLYLASLPQVDVNAKDQEGHTVLTLMASLNNITLPQDLSQHILDRKKLKQMSSDQMTEDTVTEFDLTVRYTGENLMNLLCRKSEGVSDINWVLQFPEMIDDLTHPVCLALECHKWWLAVFLIEKGADINKRGANGHTPLYTALVRRANISYWFLRHPKLDHSRALSDVTERGDAFQIQSILDKLSDLTMKERADAVRNLTLNNTTVDHPSRDAFVTQFIGDDFTTIFSDIFCASNHSQAVRIIEGKYWKTKILESPELLTVENAEHKTTLHYLLSHMSPTEVLKLESLLKQHPHVLSHVDSLGKTIFHHFAESRTDLQSLLNISSESISTRDKRGMTPLHYLLDSDNFSTIRLSQILISHGADPTVKNEEGRTPIDLASNLPPLLAQRVFSIMSTTSDTKWKESVREGLERVEKQWKERADKSEEKRREKIDKMKKEAEEINEKYKMEKNQMKRAGSLGRLTDNKSVARELDIPFIAPIDGAWKILVEDEQIWDTTLSLTDVNAYIHGTNKYALMQLLECKEQPKRNKKGIFIPYLGEPFMILRESGHVGGSPKPKNERMYYSTLEEAKAEFTKYFHQLTKQDWPYKRGLKKNNGYAVVEKIYDIKVTPEMEEEEKKSSRLEERVRDLMGCIASMPMIRKAMKRAGVDWSTLPAGRVNSSTIQEAFEILKKIEDDQITLEELTEQGHNWQSKEMKDANERIAQLSNDFFMLIPHNLSEVSQRSISSEGQLEEKTKLLERLRDIGTAVDLISSPPGFSQGVPRLDAISYGLNTRITALEATDRRFTMLTEWARRTQGGLRMKNVFAVSRNEEMSRFEPWRQQRIRDTGTTTPNNLLLFHGTKVSNMLGILRHGLRIAPPNAPRTGLAFGKGVYFSDAFAKSRGYSDGNYMFVCEVAVGKPKELHSGLYMEKPEEGFDSTKGVGRQQPESESIAIQNNGVGIPSGTIETVQGPWLGYNEFIVYDESRVKIKYIIQWA
ncbi:hypothetical protein PROFUN_16306, partial [Planoprotostelium fungivorum]